jgi:hypothetical protein
MRGGWDVSLRTRQEVLTGEGDEEDAEGVRERGWKNCWNEISTMSRSKR